MNARKVSRHPPARKTAADAAPLDARAVLNFIHADLAKVTTLARAACEALAGLPHAPQERNALRRLVVLVSLTADVATEALEDADAGIEGLDG